MGRKSREKGKRGERAAAEILRGWGLRARRGVQYSGGPDSPDVVSSLEAVHIESKWCESLSLYAALDQALDEMRSDQIPLILHKRNRRPALAILRAEDVPKFARLLTQATENEGEPVDQGSSIRAN